MSGNVKFNVLQFCFSCVNQVRKRFATSFALLVCLSIRQSHKRTPGLHPGGWISEDFDAPLPDEFWLGSDAQQ